MMKTGLFGTTLCFLTLFSPAYSPAEVYQWIDARGVINLTDNLHSVPEPVRGSPGLVIRTDFDFGGRGSVILAPHDNVVPEPLLPPQVPEAVTPSEPERTTVPTTNIFYSPQQTVVVINSTVIHPRKRACLSPEGCQGTFRPNPNDRRYIHPSAFNGGSRRYVHPGLSQPPRK